MPEFFREWLDKLGAEPTDEMLGWLLEARPKEVYEEIEKALLQNPS